MLCDELLDQDLHGPCAELPVEDSLRVRKEVGRSQASLVRLERIAISSRHDHDPFAAEGRDGFHHEGTPRREEPFEAGQVLAAPEDQERLRHGDAGGDESLFKASLRDMREHGRWVVARDEVAVPDVNREIAGRRVREDGRADRAEPEPIDEPGLNSRPENPIHQDEEGPRLRVLNHEHDEPLLAHHEPRGEDDQNRSEERIRGLGPPESVDAFDVSLREPGRDEDREQERQPDLREPIHLCEELEEGDRKDDENHEDRHAVRLLDFLLAQCLAGEHDDGNDVQEEKDPNDGSRLKEREGHNRGGERPEGPDPDDVPDDGDESDADRKFEKQAREEQDEEEPVHVQSDVLPGHEKHDEETDERGVFPVAWRWGPALHGTVAHGAALLTVLRQTSNATY